MAICLATTVTTMAALPVVRADIPRPSPRPNESGKRSTKAKPEPKVGGGFFEQLVEWTQRSSMNETDPILKKKAADDKKPPSAAASQKKSSASPQERKGFFGS